MLGDYNNCCHLPSPFYLCKSISLLQVIFWAERLKVEGVKRCKFLFLSYEGTLSCTAGILKSRSNIRGKASSRRNTLLKWLMLHLHVFLSSPRFAVLYIRKASNYTQTNSTKLIVVLRKVVGCQVQKELSCIQIYTPLTMKQIIIHRRPP